MSGSQSPLQASFEQARALIKAQKYKEARALLQKIDHPKAAEWITRLNALDPDYNPFAGAIPESSTPTPDSVIPEPRSQDKWERSDPVSSPSPSPYSPEQIAAITAKEHAGSGGTGLLIVLLVALLAVLGIGLLRFLPTERSFDTSMFHGTLPDHWFVSGEDNQGGCASAGMVNMGVECLLVLSRIETGMLPSGLIGAHYRDDAGSQVTISLGRATIPSNLTADQMPSIIDQTLRSHDLVLTAFSYVPNLEIGDRISRDIIGTQAQGLAMAGSFQNVPLTLHMYMFVFHGSVYMVLNSGATTDWELYQDEVGTMMDNIAFRDGI